MQEKISAILDFLNNQKCKDVALYDLDGEKRLTKFIIIATVSSFLENKKLAQNFMEFAGLDNQPEGFNKGEWIIFDLGEIVVHTFIPTAREKYNLDKLWQNKKVVTDKQSKKSKK